MEGHSNSETGAFWEEWNIDLIQHNVREHAVLSDEDFDHFDEEGAIAALFSNSGDLLETVSSDQDHGVHRDTVEKETPVMAPIDFPLYSTSATEKVVPGTFVLPVIGQDSNKAPVTQNNGGNRSMHRRPKRKSQSKETESPSPPKRSKRTNTTRKTKATPPDNLLGDNAEAVVRHVVVSPQHFLPIGPTAIVPITSITNFNTATLLPPAGGAPTFQIIQTHPLSPSNPTYILVPTTPQKQLPQIVPLSPVSGTLAPELLVVSPGGSLSDSVNRSPSPESTHLSSPTTATGELACSELSFGSSLSERSTPGDPVTVSSPAAELTTNVPLTPNPERTADEPSYVVRYLEHVKSCMRESCGELERDRSMEFHYIDVPLLQRTVQVRSGKNANKCLEKEMVILSDTERRKTTLTRKQVLGNGPMRQKQAIALLGKPGTGKSTFIKRLCLDWAKEGLPRYRFVFSLDCKTLNLTQPAYSLKKLLFDLPTSPHCEDPDAVFKHMLSTPGEVLIVFDSFEDFRDHEGLLHSPATCTEAGGHSIKQLFSGLFLKHLLKGCTLLIAARPNSGLTPVLRKVDSILELCGFSPVEIDLYTSRYFSEDKQRGASALVKMKQQKYVYSLCSNPLLCRYTCFILSYSDDNKRFALPSTLTGLIVKMLSLCCKQASQIQEKERPDITQLCSLAWESLSMHSSLLADQQLGSSEVRDYGLASQMLATHTVSSTPRAGETTSYSFSHTLIQTLLSSAHLVLSDNVNDKTLVNQVMGTGRRRRPQSEWHATLQQFTMGLLFQNHKLDEIGIPHSTGTSAKRKAVEAHLESLNFGEMFPGRLLELCHCVYETGSKKLARQLVKNLPDNLRLCGAQLTPPDVYVLWYLLQDTNPLKRQFSIDLQDTGITLSDLKELARLNCVTSYRAPMADTIAMWTEMQESGDMGLLKSAMNKLTLHPFKATREDHISNLAVFIQIHRERKLPCRHTTSLNHEVPAIRQLEKIDFELGPGNGPVIFPKLAQILPTLGSLVHLDLEKNKIGDSGAELLADVLNSLSSLKMLNLSQNSIGDKGLVNLAPALAAMPSLQVLSLYDNLIAESGAERLASVLPEMRCLINLDVGFNSFTDTGAQKLSESLKCCPWIKSLGMWNRFIPYGVLQHLHQHDKRIRIQHS